MIRHVFSWGLILLSNVTKLNKTKTSVIQGMVDMACCIFPFLLYIYLLGLDLGGGTFNLMRYSPIFFQKIGGHQSKTPNHHN